MQLARKISIICSQFVLVGSVESGRKLDGNEVCRDGEDSSSARHNYACAR